MGFNTSVVLFNDQMNRWPDEIVRATHAWTRHELRRRSFDQTGWFGWGQVIASEHADHDQVCVVSRNLGRYLTSVSPVQMPDDLEVLSDILRAHGYSVKGPEDARAKPPHKWGYANRLAPDPATPAKGHEGDETND